MEVTSTQILTTILRRCTVNFFSNSPLQQSLSLNLFCIFSLLFTVPTGVVPKHCEFSYVRDISHSVVLWLFPLYHNSRAHYAGQPLPCLKAEDLSHVQTLFTIFRNLDILLLH